MSANQLIKKAQLWDDISRMGSQARDKIWGTTKATFGPDYIASGLGFDGYEDFRQRSRQHWGQGQHEPMPPSYRYFSEAARKFPTGLTSGQGGTNAFQPFRAFFRDDAGEFRWDRFRDFHRKMPEISRRLKRNQKYLSALQNQTDQAGSSGQRSKLIYTLLSRGYDKEKGTFDVDRMFEPLRTLRGSRVSPEQVGGALGALRDENPLMRTYTWSRQRGDSPYAPRQQALGAMYDTAKQLGIAPENWMTKNLSGEEVTSLLQQADEMGLSPYELRNLQSLQGVQSLQELYGRTRNDQFPTEHTGKLYDLARKTGLLGAFTQQTGVDEQSRELLQDLSGQDVQKLIEAGQDIGLTPEQITSLQKNIGKATDWSRTLGGGGQKDIGPEDFIEQLRGPEGDISTERIQQAYQAGSQLERLPGVEEMREQMGPEAFQQGIELLQSFGGGNISDYVDEGRLNLERLNEDIRVGGQALQSLQQADQVSSFLASDDIEEMRQSGALQDIMSSVASGEDMAPMEMLKKKFVNEDGSFDQEGFTRFVEKGAGIAKAAGELHDDLLDQGEGDRGAFSRQQLDRMGIDPGEMASRYLKSTGKGKEMDLEAASNEIKFWNNVVDTFEDAEPAFKKRMVNTMEMVNRLGGIGFLGKGKELTRDAVGLFFDEEGNLEHPQLLGAATRLGSAAETLYTKLIEERDPMAWLGTLVGAAGVLWGLKRLFGIGGEKPARRPQDINVNVQERRPQQTQPASLSLSDTEQPSILSGMSPEQQIQLLRDTRQFL